jgi:hypothetical protein
MLFRNNSDEPADDIVLHLNPGLEVTAATVNNTPQQFDRKEHLIILDVPSALQPGEELDCLA